MKTRLLLSIAILFAQIGFTQEDITPNQLSPVLTANISSTDATSAFGNALSISSDGNTIAIGDANFSETISGVVRGGRVQVFTKENGNWVQKGQDLLSFEDQWNSFGDKVQLSADGNTLAILDTQVNFTLNAGETLEDKIGDTSEYVPYIQVYKFESGTWVQEGTDFTPLDEETFTVGLLSFSGNGKSIAILDNNEIKIFELTSGNWTQLGVGIPINTLGISNNVRMSGDGKTIIIGDFIYNDPNSGSTESFEGKVSVYKYLSGVWTQLGQDVTGTAFQQQLGVKIDITSNGETIAIGSIPEAGSYIEVFELINGNWTKKGSSILQTENGGTLGRIDLSDENSILVTGNGFARVLQYTSDWNQINLSVQGDIGNVGTNDPLEIAKDGKSFAIRALSGTNAVHIYEHNKNNITRFGDEIFGYGTQDRLGSSVSVSDNGNIIAVGANGSFNDLGTFRYGYARVYEKTNNGLQQIGADIRNTTDFDSGSFGSEVELSGNGKLLAVSAPFLGTSNYGAVYVYQRDGNTWTPLGNIIYGISGDKTGSSISFSDDGSILAVGSGGNPGGVSNDSHRGYTTIYKYSNTSNTWNILGEQIKGEAVWDYSGASIDLSGDGTIVAIGAIGNDGETATGSHGHVRVFKYNGTSWEQMGDDIDGNPDFNSSFGQIVRLSNDGKTLIASDISTQSRAGSAELYNWNETIMEWKHQTQFKTLKSSGPNNSHRFEFGNDMDFSHDGKILVIGEYLANGKGKAHVYVKNKSGTWVENQLFLEGTNNGNQFFGGNLSLNSTGNTLVVSSSGHNKSGGRTGMAAVYHLNLCSSVENFEVFEGVENNPQMPLSNNLIKNGSAELVPLTENGWTEVTGEWNWPLRQVQTVAKQDGVRYFRTNSISNVKISELYQDIDVSSYAALIDSDLQGFDFSGFIQTFQRFNLDETQIIVDYLNASENVLTSFDSGLLKNTDGWLKIEDNRTAPSGTRTIRIRLFIHNNNISQPAAFIDNITLKATLPNNFVSIPDQNFEQYLIDENIDSDGIVDGKVLKVDIENITNITIDSKNIADLTGIQEFKSLVELTAPNNQITAIDLSENTLLEKLFIANNQLTEIDLSNNTKLKNVDVGENMLTGLEVYFLTDLESLSCYKNQLTEINLFSNIELLAFLASDNQLKTLDLRLNNKLNWIDLEDNNLERLNLKNGNNTLILGPFFDVTGNPNLTCVEVDDVNYSKTNWTNVNDFKIFSEECAPSNDDCNNAVTLFAGQQILGDINQATFNAFLTDCVARNVIGDVWYKITVPETGEFSVQGTSPNGILKFALYESCASTSSIECGETLSLTNETPGKEYYLRTWLEATTSNKTSAATTVFGKFIVQINESSVLSVNQNTFSENDIQLYPNPANTLVTVSLKNGQPIDQVQLFNLIGKQILEKNNIQNNVKIEVSNFSKGVYFLRIKTNNKFITKKLIIN